MGEFGTHLTGRSFSRRRHRIIRKKLRDRRSMKRRQRQSGRCRRVCCISRSGEAAHRAVVGRLGAAQTASGAPVVVQEGPTAEGGEEVDLEGAAACRGRAEAGRRFREQAAVGLEAA